VPATAIALADFDRVLDACTRLVEGVGADQWTGPTPCTGWDVRRLVDHLTTGNRMFAAIAGGERPEGWEGLQELRARLTPAPEEDPVAAFRESGGRLRRAFGDPDFPEGTYPTPMGLRDGDAVIRMRTTETLVHGWDLAHATGQRSDFPEAVAEQTLATMRVSMAGRPRDDRTFGPEQPAADDAPALDRLAAFLGRSAKPD
jgi:uncharacterized protein (TIGR03086 family)